MVDVADRAGKPAAPGWLADKLAESVAAHKIPGAAVAVLHGDEIVTTSAGVLNKRTGVPTSGDSLFQIGSITKVWTATLIMQLVDEGLIDLDAPVRRYVPEFRVADEAASERITVRQLTCHTSGFEGDIFTDTGRGDDAVEKYVATLHDVPQALPPGEHFSYNNAGYVVLGRIVEVLRGKPFGTALREHLAAPLGLTRIAVNADEAILHRAAVGHLQLTPGADEEPAPTWSLAPSNAPAGSMLSMSAGDLVRFAQMHIREGKGPDGTQVLSGASVAQMQQPQVEVPRLGLMGDSWGIGWEIFDWDGVTVIGHDGGTLGQSATLRVVPESGLAVAMLANGGDILPAFRAVTGRLLDELAGVRQPDLFTPPAEPAPVDVARYTGTYEVQIVSLEVASDGDGKLWVTETPKGILADAGRRPETYELVPLEGDTFVTAEPRHGVHLTMTFVGSDGDGRARFLHTGRATPRTGGQ